MKNNNVENENDEILIDGELIARDLLRYPEDESLFASSACKRFIREAIERYNFTAKQCRMLKAFLEISNGRIVFTTTRPEIIKKMFGTSSSNYRNLTSQVTEGWYYLKEKQKQLGCKVIIKDEAGGLVERRREGSLKPELVTYRFIILEKLKAFIAENPEKNNTTASLERFVLSLGGKTKPIKKQSIRRRRNDSLGEEK